MPERAAARRSPRRGTLTTRAALLGVVVSVLALLVAVPLRTYVDQRGQIAATARAQAAQRHRIAVLQQQVARDQDPAYIADQARLRLQLALPGEKQYVVVEPPKPAPAPSHVAHSTALVPASAGDQTWYGALWSSAVVAGTTGAGR